MGRYIEWDDIIDRYPEMNTLGGSDELGPTYIIYSEAYVDGSLSNKFTPPFSSNNITVKDLCIDYCYWRAGRFKFENASSVGSLVQQNIEMIMKGELKMYDALGNIIGGGEKAVGYSSTESYHPAFGVDDPIDWSIDLDQIDDTRDGRD